MNKSFDIIKSKLEVFIKKYQVYKLVRGFLISIAIFIFFIITESTVEYFSYLSINTRTLLFYLSITLFLLVFVFFIIYPLLVLFNLRKGINYKEASFLISKYFPNVKDKLINTIELASKSDFKNRNNELLIASIEQKTEELKTFKFSAAINFSFLKKNFIYFILSSFLLLIIYSFAPKILFQGTNRLIKHDIYFEKEAPFNFNIKNKNFNIQQGDNFKVELLISGEYIPNSVFIFVGDNKFKMNIDENGGKNKFHYTIRNINNSINIRFFADSYISQAYKINVLPSPVLQNFTVTFIPPAYTGYKKKTFSNTGDFTVPEGTKFIWNFETHNTNSISFVTETDTNSFEDKTFIKTFRKSSRYQISLRNNYFSSKQKLEYYIKTIPDEFPIINIKEVEDSLKVGAFYYLTNIKDDYGFTKLEFVYNIKNKNDSLFETKTKEIEINKSSKNQSVFYYFDFNEIEKKYSEYYIEYYLKIYDNDYINGFKSTKSHKLFFKPLSVSDIKEKIENLDQKTKNFLDKSKNLTKEIQNDLLNYKKKELNKELSDWDKQNFANSLIKKQEKLEELLNQLSKDNKKRNEFNNQFNKEKKDLLEKQKQIQKLLDEIMDEEIRDLIKELKKLSEKFNNQKFKDVKKNFDLSYKELNEKLERSLELLKRYKIEENVLHTAEDLKKLSDKQKEISKQKINKSNKELIKKNEKKLKNELNQIKKNFEDNLKNNEELKKPFSLDEFKEEFNKIDKKFNELDSNLTNTPNRKNNKKSEKKQNEISKGLQQMSKKMQKMFGNMQMQTMQTSMEDLRQIIENLSSFSNSQEETYIKLNKTFINNPLYSELVNEQNKLKNDFLIINDSLQSLSQQLPQLSNLVLKELKNINLNLKYSTEKIEAKMRRGSIRAQRHIINSTNILALYLDELKDQLQKQMSSSGSGKGQKSNQKKMGQMKSAQENFKEMLKQMLKQMKDGKMDPAAFNKKLVKMLKEQEIFNKLLDELQNSDGINPETSKKLKEIKRMTDKNIEDLINKNINNNLLERNNKILTRLLEAENAEQKREKEKKRESEKAKDVKIKIPKELKKQFEESLKSNELLEKSNLKLRNYYKDLTKEYFINIK